MASQVLIEGTSEEVLAFMQTRSFDGLKLRIEVLPLENEMAENPPIQSNAADAEANNIGQGTEEVDTSSNG